MVGGSDESIRWAAGGTGTRREKWSAVLAGAGWFFDLVGVFVSVERAIFINCGSGATRALISVGHVRSAAEEKPAGAEARKRRERLGTETVGEA